MFFYQRMILDNSFINTFCVILQDLFPWIGESTGDFSNFFGFQLNWVPFQVWKERIEIDFFIYFNISCVDYFASLRVRWSFPLIVPYSKGRYYFLAICGATAQYFIQEHCKLVNLVVISWTQLWCPWIQMMFIFVDITKDKMLYLKVSLNSDNVYLNFV